MWMDVQYMQELMIDGRKGGVHCAHPFYYVQFLWGLKQRRKEGTHFPANQHLPNPTLTTSLITHLPHPLPIPRLLYLWTHHYTVNQVRESVSHAMWECLFSYLQTFVYTFLRKSDCLGCAVLLCLVCLFDLGPCLLLSSFLLISH